MNTFFKCLTASVWAATLTVSAQSPEETLLAVLKSDAPQQQKADACIELGRVGTRAAVAPLAALLAEEKFSHMARYGLETIPDPAVDAALRAALERLNGRLLVGVIQSVGVRRDAAAVGTRSLACSAIRTLKSRRRRPSRWDASARRRRRSRH